MFDSVDVFVGTELVAACWANSVSFDDVGLSTDAPELLLPFIFEMSCVWSVSNGALAA